MAESKAPRNPRSPPGTAPAAQAAGSGRSRAFRHIEQPATFSTIALLSAGGVAWSSSPQTTKRRHAQVMQQRREIGLLQYLAGGRESLGLDAQQHFLTHLDRFRMRLEVIRRMHAPRGDLRHRAEPAFGDFLRHNREGLPPLGGKQAAASLRHQPSISAPDAQSRRRALPCRRSHYRSERRHCQISNSSNPSSIAAT